MLKHVAIAAALTLAVTAADAQLATSPSIVTGTTSTGAPIYSAVGNGTAGSVPMPVTMGSTMRTVAGPMQINVDLTTAQGLTVPPGTTSVIIQANGTNGTNGHCLRWRDDGTDPIANQGMTMDAGQSMDYSVVGFPIRMIDAVGATCSFTAAFYR